MPVEFIKSDDGFIRKIRISGEAQKRFREVLTSSVKPNKKLKEAIAEVRNTKIYELRDKKESPKG